MSVSSREERILGIIETARAKRPRFKDPAITMAHGAGGKATQTLIEGLFAPAFGMAELADGAGTAGDVVMTTDSFVVKPLRFPGGSIGELAVNGTVNDLAVAGARPLALTLAMILEEGLDADVLRAEVDAIARAATAAGVAIVVRRHQGRRARARRRDVPGHDRRRRPGPAREPQPAIAAPRRPDPAVRLDRRARHGDHDGPRRVRPRGRGRVRHALAVAGRRRAARGGRAGAALHARRHPRRRGLRAERAGARVRRVAMSVREGEVPVSPVVAGAAEILGIDPMYVANEGKLVAFVAPELAGAALAALRAVTTRRRRRSAK